MTEVEKILAGTANINDYSLENDFYNDEIKKQADFEIFDDEEKAWFKEIEAVKNGN